MPVEQTIPPTLIEVRGTATKDTSVGGLDIEIIVTPGANGWPPADELNQLLLELFNQVGYLGWVGSVNQRFISETKLTPNPPDTTPTTVIEPVA